MIVQNRCFALMANGSNLALAVSVQSGYREISQSSIRRGFARSI